MIAPLNPFENGLTQRTREMFGPGGLLSKARHYEHRTAQQDMAEGVARALEQQRHLVVEAGTGVGKSLAYLIPSICFAHEQGRKALISTHTINLQEQLFLKDIPLAEKLLPFDFKATLLKGRQNYICPQRLARAMAHAGDLFVSSERAELERIWQWLQKTQEGTLSDFESEPDFKVWSQVCSEPHACTVRTCGNDPKCFYQQARKRLVEANLVVLNHTLFFSCLGGLDEEGATQEGYLFPNDFVVFDEAHNLEQTAARHIGISVSSASFRYQLQRLYHPSTRKGLLSVLRDAGAQKLVTELLEGSDVFFGKVEAACNFQKGNEFRVRQPELAEDTLALPLMQLRQNLLELAEGSDDEIAKSELREAARRFAEMRDELKVFLSQDREEYVYWVEKTGRDRTSLQLQAAPVDLAQVLRQYIFRPGHSAILTSATLSTGQGLEYFQKRTGSEEAEALQLQSPFDYARQMKVYIPKKIPEPGAAKLYEVALEQWIAHFTRQTRGHALVLFTSYGLMHRIAEVMRPWFAGEGMELMVQGGGMSRRLLVEKFKIGRNAVLFGTDSFWQGVDLPGEMLQNVILTRLPFAVPDHPLVQAKLERIEERGGDPFREYSLPEAVLKFRQGVGRLIRTATDQGQIAVLDSRILSKSYGKSFLAILPDCPVILLDDNALDGTLEFRDDEPF